MEKISKKRQDFTLYNNATDIGRGTWFMNHLKSFNIIDNIDVESCYRDIRLLTQKFPCHNCRKHFTDYFNANNPRHAADKDLEDIKRGIRPENLSRWLVDGHNNANRHKYESHPQFHDLKFRPDDAKYEDVRTYFDSLGQEPCMKDCDKPEVFKEELKTVKVTPTPTKNIANRAIKSSTSNSTSSTSSTSSLNKVRFRIVPAPTQN